MARVGIPSRLSSSLLSPRPAQPIIAHQDRFVFSATLAIYIYSVEDCRLLSILARHDEHLTGVAYSPHDSAMLACATLPHVSGTCAHHHHLGPPACPPSTTNACSCIIMTFSSDLFIYYLFYVRYVYCILCSVIIIIM